MAALDDLADIDLIHKDMHGMEDGPNQGIFERKGAEQLAAALILVVKHAHLKLERLQDLQGQLIALQTDNIATHARLQAAESESAHQRGEVERWQRELLKQREMYSNALAQSEKLAQAELSRRMKEALEREMVLVKAMESLKQGSSTCKQIYNEACTPVVYLELLSFKSHLFEKIVPSLCQPALTHPQEQGQPLLLQYQEGALDLVEDGNAPVKKRRRRRKTGDEGDLSDPDNRYSTICVYPGCDRYSSYGFEPRSRQRCSEHVLPGMRNVKNLRCHHPGCLKTPTYNFPSDKPRTRPARCSQHKLAGMVDVNNRHCMHEGGCSRQPSFGFEGDKRPSRCAAHKLDGMYDIRSRLCSQPGCKIRPLFGYLGERFPTRCKTHILDGMQNILHIKCGHPTCRGKPVFGFEIEGKPLRCLEHVLENMVDLRKDIVT